MRTILALTGVMLVFVVPAQAQVMATPMFELKSGAYRWLAEVTSVVAKAKTQPKPKAKKRKRPANHDLWVRIGRCEQPGRGYMGVNWSHRGPTYQGGLGFWYGTWQSFKESWMPSNAGDASWRAQMQVANKLYRAYGTSPWGCG